MPLNNPMLTGSVATDLGLGDALRAQQKDETEEQRKRRLLAERERGFGAIGSVANTLIGTGVSASGYGA